MNARAPLPGRVCCALLGALLGVSAPGAGSAAAEESDAARLFGEGRALLIAGRFAEACRMLDESQRLEPRLGTQLNVAFCQERLGNVASAWLGFRAALLAARSAGDAEREAFAASRARALEPRVPWLRVRAAAAPGAELPAIVCDGAMLAPDAVGQEQPLDPGEHSVSARHGGEEYWRTRVVLAESQHVDLSVPPPPAATRRAASSSAAGAAAPEASQPASSRWVYEAGAFAGFIVVDTNTSEPEEDPASLLSNVGTGDDTSERASCATAFCEYGSLGSSTGVVAGAMGYLGYTVSPGASLGARLLLGARVNGGGLFALGPSASLSVGERWQLGPALLVGAASHAGGAPVVLDGPDGTTSISARLHATLGLSMGAAAELGYRLLESSSGSVVLLATPLILFGPNGMSYSLPLGAAYRWH